MQVTHKQLNAHKSTLMIVADDSELDEIKQTVLARLATNVKIAGFREGKAPLPLVERQVNSARLQTEFLETAINRLYVKAVDEIKLRPVGQPEISITKFVPFTVLHFHATVEAVGKIKLPDYKAITVSKKPVKITSTDVNEVIERLRLREAQKKDVDRVSQLGDEVLIDFTGHDPKTQKSIQGADGKDYPLVLGSNTFIPGFEPELVGLKAGQDKVFRITFPKDYGVQALRAKVVEFHCNVKKVQEVLKPVLDEAFAAKIGPFHSLEALNADIKAQLTAEQEQNSLRLYENELVNAISDQSDVSIPEALIEEQIEQLERQERQNLAYRGQTWSEHLKDEGVSEKEHRDNYRKPAEQRVKASLVLSEIAEREGITVTPEELEIRIQLLKGQYPDKQMQAELDKPENRLDIMNRLVTEKTLQVLTGAHKHTK